MPGTFYTSVGVTSRDYKYINNSVKIKNSIFSGEEILLFEDNVFTSRRFYPAEQQLNNVDPFQTFTKRSRIMWYYNQYGTDISTPIWFRAVTVMRGSSSYGFDSLSKRHVLFERPLYIFNFASILSACKSWVQNIFDVGGIRRDSEFSLYIQLYIPCNGLIEPPHIASLVNTSYQDLSPTWEASASYETHYTRWYRWGNLTSYDGLLPSWAYRITTLGTASFFGALYKYIDDDAITGLGKLWGTDQSTYSPFTLWTSWWTWFRSLDDQNLLYDFIGANLYLEEKGRIFKKPISPIRGFKYEHPNKNTLWAGGQYPQLFGSVSLVYSNWPRFDCPDLGNPEIGTIWNFMQNSQGLNSYNNLNYEPVTDYQKLTYRMTQSSDVITIKQDRTSAGGTPNYAWQVIDSRNYEYFPHDPFNLTDEYSSDYAPRYSYGGGLNLIPYSAACFIVQLCGDVDLNQLEDQLKDYAEAYAGHLPQLINVTTTLDIVRGFVVSAEYYELSTLLQILLGLTGIMGVRVWQGHYFKLALFPDKATSLVYTLPAEASRSLLYNQSPVETSNMIGALLTFKDERMTIPMWTYSRLASPRKSPSALDYTNINSAEVRLGNLISTLGLFQFPYNDKYGFFNKMRPGNVEMRFCTFKRYTYTSPTNMNSGEGQYNQNRNEFGRLADKKLILKRYGKNLTFHVVFDKSPSDVLLPQSVEISYPV